MNSTYNPTNRKKPTTKEEWLEMFSDAQSNGWEVQQGIYLNDSNREYWNTHVFKNLSLDILAQRLVDSPKNYEVVWSEPLDSSNTELQKQLLIKQIK